VIFSKINLDNLLRKEWGLWAPWPSKVKDMWFTNLLVLGIMANHMVKRLPCGEKVHKAVTVSPHTLVCSRCTCLLSHS